MTAMSPVLLGIGIQILLGAFALVLPDRTRPDLLFAVTVDPAIRRRTEGQVIVARYRRETAALVVLAIVLLGGTMRAGLPWGFPAGLLLELAALGVTYYRAHRRTLPFAVAPTTVRESALGPQPSVLPAAWAQGGPFAILAAIAWYLHTHWSAIPERFPVHWNLTGQPDRWAPRTVSGVYGGLMTATALCILMLLISWATARWSRPIQASGPGAADERRFKRTMLRLLLLSEYFIVGVFAFISWMAIQAAPVLPAVLLPVATLTSWRWSCWC